MYSAVLVIPETFDNRGIYNSNCQMLLNFGMFPFFLVRDSCIICILVWAAMIWNQMHILEVRNNIKKELSSDALKHQCVETLYIDYVNDKKVGIGTRHLTIWVGCTL